MKLGSVVSCVGDLLVVSPEKKGDLGLRRLRMLLNKMVFLDRSRVGRVFDVIGRVDDPYLVVRAFKNSPGSDILKGKTLYVK